MDGYLIRNDVEIANMITCDKRISKRPSSPKTSNRDIKQKIELISTDGTTQYNVFFAQNLKLLNDFSLGLMLDRYLLLRINGFHGTTIANFHRYDHHAYAHSHTLTYDDILSGRESSPSKIEAMVGNYYNFESAQLYFFEHCNILNYDEYFDFSKLKQISLDDYMEGGVYHDRSGEC